MTAAMKSKELKGVMSTSIDPIRPFPPIPTLVGENQQKVMRVKNSDTDPHQQLESTSQERNNTLAKYSSLCTIHNDTLKTAEC